MRDGKPLVSVVVPVYRVERFLPACMESLLGQTYENLEILLIDDGSPDGCPALCDDYAAQDGRVRAVHQQNGGLSRARNAGLALAGGDYVYFLDSDDMLRPDALERLVAAAEESGAELVFFNARLIREDGAAHERALAHVRKGEYPSPKPGAEMLGELLQNGEFMTPVPYLFFRRGFLGNRRFCPDIVYEDVLFTFTAFLDAGITAYLPEPLYFYRIRGNSIMTGRVSRRHYESLLFVYEQIEQRLAQEQRHSVRQTIAAYLATLQTAAVNLFWRLPLAERARLAGRRRAFYRRIDRADYAATAENRPLFRRRSLYAYGVYFLNRYVPARLRLWIKRLRKAGQNGA